MGPGHRLERVRPWIWGSVLLGAVACIVAAVRPIAVGPIAYDGAAGVLYFDRILTGARLETFVNTTPKPLLTFVYGSLYTLAGDWRAVTFASVVIAASAAVLGGRLALRFAGPTGAIAAVVVIAAGARMLTEVSWSHGVPWALAAWLVAGLSLTGERPRYVAAGIALLLGALARQKTYLLTASASVLAIVLVATGRATRSALWILLGWLAIPTAAAHDLLLTGDPGFSYRVASISAAGIQPRTPLVVSEMIGGELLRAPLLTLASLVGVAGLLRVRRGWIVALGIAVLVGGTAALLLALSALGRQTHGYYLNPLVVPLTFGAALGVGYMANAVLARVASRDGPRNRVGWVMAAAADIALIAVAAVVLAPGLLGATTLTDLRDQRRIAADTDAAVGAIRSMLEAEPLPVPMIGDPEVRPNPAWTRILVPRPVQTRVAVDLGLPITTVGPLVPNRPTAGVIHPGLIVYHDRYADPRNDVTRAFERASPVTVEGVTFELVARPRAGVWIWRSVDPPAAP